MAKKKISGVNLTIIIMVVIMAAYFATGAYNYSEPTREYPENAASFDRVDSVVGCKSTYSDEKKNDVFAANYKEHWMTWSGTIDLVGNGKVSINCNGKGTQDLDVRMIDKGSTYNLEKGQRVSIKFLMDSIGGCFLPFSGREGHVQ